MPQETNLNVAPSFDDFDPQSNYYKVLFKPAHPVQARELNNLQSILQNQIEDMGTHFFKEGAKVIPGQLTYLPQFYAIQIEPEYLGIPVDLYLQQLIGKRIVGATSGVTAEVVTFITDQESENGNFTLYVNYFQSSKVDNTTQTFSDNEILLTDSNITFETTFIASGEGFAKTLTENANAVGSAFALGNGVYFLRGTFVDVQDQILILDQYTNKPSFRIGLSITESLISSDIDPSLNDNAKNFTNFTAPGADRLQISAILGKKDNDDFNDQNFVQLAEVQNGILREVQTGTGYNILGDELAKRTFDESGHYYVKEFVTTVRESLNNGIGNRGIYNANQTTTGGETPSKDKIVYKISPGKAYVRGYPIEFVGPTLLDAEKARTTKTVENQSVNFGFGPTFTVNNVSGAPTLGFDTDNVISLRSERVGVGRTSEYGKEIGVARVYDFALETGSYEISQLPLNQWDLTLFDVQTYNDFTVNEETTLSIPTFIEGESSGAKAYLRYPVTAGIAFTAYDVKGTFSLGERLKFNGEDSGQRSVIDSSQYKLGDIQSVYGIVGSGSTFTADLLPQSSSIIGIASITGQGQGISTITTPGLTFPGIATVGNLVKYSIPSFDFPSLGKIVTVNTNSLEIVGVQTVTGFIDGDVPQADVQVTDLEIVSSRVQTGSNQSGNISDNHSLFSVLPNKYISNVDVSKSSLVIRRQFDVEIADNSTGAVNAGPNEVFLPFDEERYSLLSDVGGDLEVLSSDRFTFSAGNTQITINGLANNGPAKLVATLRKSAITPKIKTKKVVQTVTISKSNDEGSGIGATTLNDGLSYGSFPYGTRVQDQEICLNVPDVITVYGIFQGSGSNTPVAPTMTLGSMDGPTNTTNDLIIGEEFIGSISGSRAMYVTRSTDTNIEFIYRNTTPFQPGEVINFQDSGVSAVATNISQGSKNITKDFEFQTGQKKSIYDFGKIIRRQGSSVPNNKLTVYYMSAEYQTADTGDITVCSSYNDFNYDTDISSVSGFRNTDMVDGRPRVSNYTVGDGNRSPFEFYGRSFNGGQHSSRNILASDESMSLTFDYYQGRIDRIYIDKDGVFSTKKGVPADVPVPPKGNSASINIANVYLPPYTPNVENIRVTFIKHKRYQMSDISRLERRIRNLEYYTALNQLESTTLNSFIPDSNGLNRFKSGIFVDNFSTLDTQDLTIGAKNSIDVPGSILRPSHYTTAFNLMVGNSTMTGIGNDANGDTRFANILGENTRRTGKMVTLDYTERSWLRNPFATRTESVTPFLVRYYNGHITFDPTVDVWIEVTQQDERIVDMEGSFLGVAEAMKAEVSTDAEGKRSGLSPVIWQSWETTGVDVSVDLDSSTSSTPNSSKRQGTQEEFNTIDNGRFASRTDLPSSFLVHEESTTTTTTTTATVGVTLNQQRKGTQRTVTEEIETGSFGDRVVKRRVVNFMRSRNIEFTARSMKPFTRVYAFFDGSDVNKQVMPKLVEITMTSGTFEVGETVKGKMPSTTTSQTTSGADSSEEASTDGVAEITLRVANTNHKFGPYNDPTDTYDRNPYDRDNRIETDYTESSSILNVDTFSLSAEEDFSGFFGFIATGMTLTGETSGAQATISNVRLVTDRVGTVIGSFRIPSSNDETAQRFETGNNLFRLTSSETNSKVEGLVTTSAEDNFYSQASEDTTQETTLSLRNARVEHNDDFLETRNSVSGSGSDTTTSSSTSPARLTGEYTDPLAQTFIVDDVTGVYLTGIDLFFSEKPGSGSSGATGTENLTQVEIDALPVTVQIREVELGIPNSTILPFSEVEVGPEDIQISDDASVATRFEFESPVYINGQREYSVVILSQNIDYRLWISRLGEVDVSSISSPESDQILVSTQTLLGSLLKSQNASTWTPSQYEDLTFNLYRANFVPSGNVQLFNPNLPVDVEIIPDNGVVSQSKTIRVGLGTTAHETGLLPGQLITQTTTGATGRFVGYGGSAIDDSLKIINVGAGFTPSSGTLSYTNVPFTSISGHGRDAIGGITITNGVAVAATITSGGEGYQVGDILSPTTVGLQGLGSGIRVSISTIFASNELTITDVQGDFGTGSGEILNYTNSSGTQVVFDVTANPAGQVPTSPVIEVTSGDHLTINQRNHGMYSNTNLVTLRDIRSTVEPTSLTAAYESGATGNISIASTVNFIEFENLAVSATNPGYILMNDELISYTGTDNSNNLTGITRGIDDTNVINHTLNEIVTKYEFYGVSLRRINKTHNMNEVTDSDPFDTDFYKVKIDSSKSGLDRTTSLQPSLFFNATASGGGKRAKGSYNLPFSEIHPRIVTVTPTGTNIEPSIRTITSTSISGNEGSFVDKGFEKFSLEKTHYFDSQRMVASQANEDTFLDELPSNKSLTVSLNMSSDEDRLTPAIDLDSLAMVFTSNRVNNPISDYASDPRADTIINDPNKFMYVTQLISLSNSATSIQVLCDAYLSEFSDLRMFFAIDQDTSAKNTIFTPFPGNGNFGANGSVINMSNNNGLPDNRLVKADLDYLGPVPTNQFREYKFSIDSLPSFTSFRIKMVGTSSNQAYPPMVRNFRALGLA